MTGKDGLHISLPKITKEIEWQIDYMKEHHPHRKSFYDVMTYVSLFQYSDPDLEWLYQNSSNMDSFAMAWILDEWIVI